MCAPLSRVLGLADLCSNFKELSKENQWIVLELIASARELDQVIKNISGSLAENLESADRNSNKKPGK